MTNRQPKPDADGVWWRPIEDMEADLAKHVADMQETRDLAKDDVKKLAERLTKAPNNIAFEADLVRLELAVREYHRRSSAYNGAQWVMNRVER